MRRKLIFIAPLAILAFVGFIAIGGAIVQALWNWLLPPLFGWKAVTFWQALALLALCRILFGGFRLGGATRSRVRERMADHWDRMSPEDRERFRQRMRERWGFSSSGSEPPPAAPAP